MKEVGGNIDMIDKRTLEAMLIADDWKQNL
jgi:hypothetical protein